MTANPDRDRFLNDAHKYALYLETPEGRLRSDLALANLQEFLPRSKDSLRALDLGCGTGAAAIRLAQLSMHVTAIDSSPAMLDIARSEAQKSGVVEQVACQHGDVLELTNQLPAGSFDVILCHNLLEYVGDPTAVLRAACRILRDSTSLLSVVVRNQAGEVFKAAIKEGDLAAAENNLTAEWGHESLYGGKVRLFRPAILHGLLTEASLAAVAERGIRVLADYLPPQISRSADYERIFDLERKLGSRPEYAAVSRYTHLLARRADPVKEGGA